MDLEVAHRKIFIGGLSYGTDDDKLRKYFEVYGRVQDAVVMKDPVSRRSRGFGFITFDDEASVDNALAQEVHTIDSRRVEAKRAVPRSEFTREAVSPKHISSSPPTESKSSDDIASNKIFVGGLHYDTRDDDFRGYFEKYGKVVSAEVMFNRDTHKSRGFGFIVFESESSVDAVCAQREHIIDSKTVEVKRAVPRSRLGSSPSLSSQQSPTSSSSRPQSRGGTGMNSSGGALGPSTRHPSESSLSDTSSIRSTPTSMQSNSLYHPREPPSPLHLSSPAGSLSQSPSGSSGSLAIHARKLPPTTPPSISRSTTATSYAAALRYGGGTGVALPPAQGRPGRSQSDPVQFLAVANKHMAVHGLTIYQQVQQASQQLQQQQQQQHLQQQQQQQQSGQQQMQLQYNSPQHQHQQYRPAQHQGQSQQQQHQQQGPPQPAQYPIGTPPLKPLRQEGLSGGTGLGGSGYLGMGGTAQGTGKGMDSSETDDQNNNNNNNNNANSLLNGSLWLPTSLSTPPQRHQTIGLNNHSHIIQSNISMPPPASGLSVIQDQIGGLGMTGGQGQGQVHTDWTSSKSYEAMDGYGERSLYTDVGGAASVSFSGERVIMSGSGSAAEGSQSQQIASGPPLPPSPSPSPQEMYHRQMLLQQQQQQQQAQYQLQQQLQQQQQQPPQYYQQNISFGGPEQQFGMPSPGSQQPQMMAPQHMGLDPQHQHMNPAGIPSLSTWTTMASINQMAGMGMGFPNQMNMNMGSGQDGHLYMQMSPPPQHPHQQQLPPSPSPGAGPGPGPQPAPPHIQHQLQQQQQQLHQQQQQLQQHQQQGQMQGQGGWNNGLVYNNAHTQGTLEHPQFYPAPLMTSYEHSYDKQMFPPQPAQQAGVSISYAVDMLSPKPSSTMLFHAQDSSESRYNNGVDELDDLYILNELHLTSIASPEPS